MNVELSGERTEMPIGGESDFKGDGFFSYMTDSGRSSLRLILQGGFRDKKFLLPDFLCKVIPELFDELQINYAYYKIDDDFSVNLRSVKAQQFDVLYLIDYFGRKEDSQRVCDLAEWFIEDCVFLPVLEPPHGINNWIGFNSFRKMSCLADGSIVRSNVQLNKYLISDGEAGFSSLKYAAKRIKYEYLHENRHCESDYLSLFSEAEQLIDKQKGIFSISQTSMFNLFDFYRNMEKEYAIRRDNYMVLHESLHEFGKRIDTEFPIFYVLDAERRDELRNYLFGHNIFLPVHWPRIKGSANSLYERTISIPVDSRYGAEDMKRVAACIRRFYDA